VIKIIGPQEEGEFQWTQNPSQMNGNDLKNIQREIKTFRNNWREHLKENSIISMK
jgi:hypothetical protein